MIVFFQFWRSFLPLSLLFCIGVSFAPIWHIIDDSVSFRKSLDPSFAWYYTVVVSARPSSDQVSVWFHMLIVTLVCNILSFILYAACFVRFCMFSVARNYTVERNFFLVGVLSMLFSLPFASTMLFLGINLAPGSAGVSSETLISVSFQVPWLTDLKFLSPAPILLITNSSIRAAISRMLLPTNQISGFSQSTHNTQIF
ncbi:hypothetical protein PRIPAC_80754 [Pristionchus pacificus]|uniref:Uncharacterized protein n=1 Tax=Pristionchus pacificus TaxID=54126 RepID=A0A2A6CK65_PRIPA|nr:hypothetical protein PRIPAC_80754 [Pristionchus pacificus]|eukprot:PDM78421.1 hypothetical protein PRIPAC_31000 [Pristionchus pacificus]